MKKNRRKFPWGYTEVLTEGESYKVKRVSIIPNSRQSYQSHEYRAESWMIVSGKGKITIEDKESEDDYGRHLDNWADVDADLL